MEDATGDVKKVRSKASISKAAGWGLKTSRHNDYRGSDVVLVYESFGPVMMIRFFGSP